jgi:hypothetical protein
MEILKAPVIILIAIVVVVILLTIFIFPMLFDIFIGRGVCKFMGNSLAQVVAGSSIFSFINEAAVNTLCDLLPF